MQNRVATGFRHVLPVVALLLLGLLIALPALAQDLALPAFSSKPAPGGGQSYTLSVQTLLMLTALSFLPSVLLLMTSFTRIIIVLSLVRHALGVQSTPSNQVLIGLSLFLTLFVLMPTSRSPKTRSDLARRWKKGRCRCTLSCCARRAKRTWRCLPASPISHRCRMPRRCRSGS
jgi:hypothetical protein